MGLVTPDQAAGWRNVFPPLTLGPPHGACVLCHSVCVYVCHSLFELWWLSGDRLPVQKTQETRVHSLGQEEPLVERMAARSRILAWEMPWSEGVWQTTVHRVAESDTAEDARIFELLFTYASIHLYVHYFIQPRIIECIHLEALFYMVVLYLTLESSVKLEDVVCGGGKTQILGQNMNVGPTEGESGGLPSQLCPLGSARWRVMRCFRVLWVQRRDGVHLGGLSWVLCEVQVTNERRISFSKPLLCLVLRPVSSVFKLGSGNDHLSDSNNDNRESKDGRFL